MKAKMNQYVHLNHLSKAFNSMFILPLELLVHIYFSKSLMLYVH